jgi:hypothetical protein
MRVNPRYYRYTDGRRPHKSATVIVSVVRDVRLAVVQARPIYSSDPTLKRQARKRDEASPSPPHHCAAAYFFALQSAHHSLSPTPTGCGEACARHACADSCPPFTPRSFSSPPQAPLPAPPPAPPPGGNSARRVEGDKGACACVCVLGSALLAESSGVGVLGIFSLSGCLLSLAFGVSAAKAAAPPDVLPAMPPPAAK